MPIGARGGREKERELEEEGRRVGMEGVKGRRGEKERWNKEEAGDRKEGRE